MEESILIWGLALILGFPLASLLLGEAIDRLERDRHPLAKFLRNTRTLILPPLAVLLVMRLILDVTGGFPLRIVETVYWIAAIITCLSLVNAVLTTKSKSATWQLQVPNLFFQVARALVVLAIASYLLGGIWDVDLSRLAGALGVGSLVIALALQDTLSNLVSGFLLLFSKPFVVGDWIKYGDYEGRVIDLNWRAVTIETIFKVHIVIPNGVLGQETIVNYSMEPARWDSIQIGFSYDHPTNYVMDVLKSLTADIKDIATDPAPFACVDGYDDFAITYSLWFWVLPEKAWFVQNELKGRIFYAAKRHDLNIPFPIRTLHHVRTPTSVPDVSIKIAEFMHSLPYFTSLEEAAIASLARTAEIEHYGKGERIVKEGDFDLGLYIIEEGAVKLSVADNRDRPSEVVSLGRGDFFGEMALLPGEASLVSVTVIEDLKAIFIDSVSAINSIQGNSKFIAQMNKFVEQRTETVHLVKGRKNLLNN